MVFMVVPPRMLSEDGAKRQSDRTIILWGVNVGEGFVIGI
jgi:hypothetical protein